MKPLLSRLFWLAVLVAALLAVRHSMVFVDETDYVVVTNFDEAVGRFADACGHGAAFPDLRPMHLCGPATRMNSDDGHCQQSRDRRVRRPANR